MKKWLALVMSIILVVVCSVGCSSPQESITNSKRLETTETSDQQDKGKQTEEKSESWTPEKEIQCIVPFAPGGGSDILTRLLMEHMNLPKPMVAINVEGSAGLIGAEQAAKASADGYTILAHNPMNLIAQGLTGTNDLWSKLTLLSFIVDDWEVVCTNKESGWETVDDLIEAAQKEPGKLKWGVTGSGITLADSMRAMEGLGIDCQLVPYDGGSETRAALLGGHIQIELSTSSDVRSYVESGDVVPLFVIANERCPFLDVPTLLEMGIDVTSGAPRAYFGPPNLDEEIVNFYAKQFYEVCNNEEFIKACEDLGFVVSYVDPEEGRARMEEWFEANEPIFEKEGFGK